MSYLELAKRSRNRALGGWSAVEAVLRTGDRLTAEEVAARCGGETRSVRRELAEMVERGEAVTAVDFHRRVEVFWSRLGR